MASPFCPTAHPDQLSILRRLVASRWAVLSLTTLLVLIGPASLDIPVSQPPLLAILAIALVINTLVAWRLRQATSATPIELVSQLLFDILVLSALLFFSGGATNPLVSLLLPPVALAALALPARCVLLVGGAALGAYSALMLVYLPLPLPDATRATRLHLAGMWITFALSASMIAWFVVRMTQQLRERDAALAAAREQALRDERIMAMGTLAAGAAHELGTPLGTMALIAGELAHDARQLDLPAQWHEDLALLRQQIGVCKQIITGLSRRAGAERLENSPRQHVDRWIEQVRQHWTAIHPQADSRLLIQGEGDIPEITADPRLEQALLNLLNNAAQAAGPGCIDIALSWTQDSLHIDIRDNGPGFPATVLAGAGQQGFGAHAHGSGVGLMLTRSALEQLGGSLSLSNPDSGGALARITLPRFQP